MRRVVISVGLACALGVALLAAAAQADFPYPDAGGPEHDWSKLHVPSGTLPNDLDSDDWRFFASPEDGNFPVNNDPRELNGRRGGWVADPNPGESTAWSITTGRPEVKIAELDSGVKWNDRGLVIDERFKLALNAGELPTPNHAGPDLVGSTDCASYADADDANGDGIFNLRDFACDNRVTKDPANGVGPTDLLDPQDLLIAFTNGDDADGNGYPDDIAGWDFLDDDNDAFDDVQYGHGTGEIRGSTAEANNDADVGFCPNCLGIPLRVGNSFVADDNRFAMATLYGVDNGALIIQEALGTLNDSGMAQDAIDYAFRHGVAVIASAADEAAQHHNYPSAHEKPIVVNSVTEWNGDVPEVPRTYVAFNGCTNFSSKITLAIPSTSCSSNATEVGAGMAGLIYSSAMNAIQQGKLQPNPRCTRVDGSPCPISANEVRQLMASGTVGGQTMPDDINYLAGSPLEPSCSPSPGPGCTDPNLALQQQINANRPIVSPPDSRSYPARKGPDQFFGWGRANTWRSASEVGAGHVPPEVEITSPEWFDQVDPTKPAVDVKAQVWARGAGYTCTVYAAPGSYPNNNLASDAAPGDFMKVGDAGDACNGTTSRTDPLEGTVARISLAQLKARFPNDATASGFRGTEPGSGAGQTSNGRPNSEPYGFTIRVVATRTAGFTATGEDRRNLYLHRDRDMVDGFPRQLASDGESSPVFADLNGDNRNEMLFGTSDGFVHAMRPNATDLPGWPRRTDRLPQHPASRAYASGEVSRDSSHGAILSSVAVGDLNRDGNPEVVATDMEGKVYAWGAAGKLLWKREANRDFSGRPLVPFVNERLGHRDRTVHAIVASPVLADLDHNDGGRLEVIAAAMDRHLYAWNDGGAHVTGFPVLVNDPSKIGSIDPQSHQIRWNPQTAPLEGNDNPDQGEIIDTPAVADISGDSRPEIVLGTNEQYHVNVGNEGPRNAGGPNAASLQAAGPVLEAADLTPANTRLHAIRPTGDADGDPKTGDWIAAGNWPFKVALLESGLLPVVGEGISGAPVIAPASCVSSSGGPNKIGVIPNNGFAYVLNPDGKSCVDGNNGTMDTDKGSGGDRPQLAAVGHPAFVNLGGRIQFAAPVAGLIRALDLLANEYQIGGQDFVSVWDPGTGQYRPGFPAHENDLQFLTGPSAADVDGATGDELLEGSAYLDLEAFDANGQSVSGWPKLTSDWMVANPLIGTWGTLDTNPAARRTVVAITRKGTILAYRTKAPPCQPNAAHPLGSWPRFHHDPANSGDYSRDAVAPGVPMAPKFAKGKLTFRAPGDDLLCGHAARYQLVESDRKLGGGSFGQGIAVPVAAKPKDPGAQETIELGGQLQRYLLLRAVDDQGNVGRTVRLPTGAGGGKPGGGGNGGGGPKPTCVDLNPPQSAIVSRSVKKRGAKGITVRGHSFDGGCRNRAVAKKRNAIAASVALARRDGRGCHWLEPARSFGKRRGCGRPTFHAARGVYRRATKRLTWSFHTAVTLPPGRYVAIARAVDQSGNVETHFTKRNRKRFIVKKRVESAR
ncbi:MAG TPA: hypothetical protein VJT75_13955 [Thermoleophilaceae bacterium]|nr:hypothetical protein [Thermoleophilaceae bacterium]